MRWVTWCGLGVLLCPARAPDLHGQEAREAPRIADNSFLLEEAYNQEPRVVQHISTYQREWSGSAWSYTFIQEWPLRGRRHQASFTVPLQRLGLGDVALNYRYQLVGTDGRLSAAPRLSVLLPTGDERKGLGAGAPGLQVNVPVSLAVSGALATHWNAGATLTPSARDGSGAGAMTTGFNLGASTIWLARATVNLLVEVVWSRAEGVTGPGTTAWAESWFVNPGVRWAHNFPSGLQIVPGIGVPIGIGPSAGERSVLLYLSFEHPF